VNLLAPSGNARHSARVMPKRLVAVIVLSVLTLATLGALASFLG
jgi:hypothetical protein